MKCPYCAEEIKDEAVFCRHCNHDFGLIKPLWAKLITTENDVKALANAPRLHELEAAKYYSLFAAAVAVTLAIVWTSGLYFALVTVPEPTDNVYVYMLTIALPPAVFGLLTGLVSGSRSATIYFSAGLLLGSLNLFFIYLILSGPGGTLDWDLALFTFLIGQPLTFTTLTLLGNTLRNRPPKIEPGVTGLFDKIVAIFGRISDLSKSVAALGGTLYSAYKMLTPS